MYKRQIMPTANAITRMAGIRMARTATAAMGTITTMRATIICMA